MVAPAGAAATHVSADPDPDYAAAGAAQAIQLAPVRADVACDQECDLAMQYASCCCQLHLGMPPYSVLPVLEAMGADPVGELAQVLLHLAV